MDPTFGTRPNCHILTRTINDTICGAIINGVLDIDKYADLVMIVCWTLTKTFLIRGCKEHSKLSWHRFKFGLYKEECGLKGHPYVELLPGTDKASKMHLGNHTLQANK